MNRRLTAYLVILILSIFAVFSFRAFIPRASGSSSDVSSKIPPADSKFSVVLPRSRDLPLPEVSAIHIFILDRDSKMVLYSRAADDHIYPASTTKMMTAVVASEHFSLDSQLTVQHQFPEGSHIGLRVGEKVTAQNLLYALLVQSANDAAEVIAENFCTYSKLSPADQQCGRDAFVSEMNATAQRLNLRNTHFLNPTGLDQEGHYSSASDLARLADYLLKNDNLRRIVSTENAVVASVDLSDVHPVTNVNQLLGKVPGVIGVKTGFTDLAGESLVVLVNRDGHEVIMSVMGSRDRFGDATRLIDWVYSDFSWD